MEEYVYGKYFYGKNIKFKVNGVSIPSKEEIETVLDGCVLRNNDFEPYYIYLRDEYDDGIGIAEIREDGECIFDDVTDPDYEDKRAVYIEDQFHNECLITEISGTGIRPVLYIESEEKLPVKRGEVIYIGDEALVFVSDNMLLLDRSLFDGESETYGIFDEETNIYDDSLAKQRVDSWFETCIKPYLKA